MNTLFAELGIGVGASRCLPNAIVHICLICFVSHERIPFGELPSRGAGVLREEICFLKRGSFAERQRTAHRVRPQEQGRSPCSLLGTRSRTGRFSFGSVKRNASSQPVLIAAVNIVQSLD